MNKIVLLPIGILLPTPLDIPPRLFAKALVHNFEFKPQSSTRYSADVPAIGLVTVLSSYYLGLSTAVITWVDKAYLELDGLLILFLILWG